MRAEKYLSLIFIILLFSILTVACNNEQINIVENTQTDQVGNKDTDIKNPENTILESDSKKETENNKKLISVTSKTIYGESQYFTALNDALIWKDKLWFVEDYNIYSFDFKTNTLETRAKLELIPEFAGDYEGTSVSDDNLWIYGYSHPPENKYTSTGIARYNITTGELTEYNNPKLNNIATMDVKEVNNILYIDSGGDGLYKFDYKNNNIEEIDLEVQPYQIENIDGELWVATFDNGIYILNEDGEITHLTKDNGLLSNEIYSLVPLNNGVLIALSDKTMSLYTSEPEKLIHYNLEKLKRIRLFYDKNDLWVADQDNLWKITDETDLSNWFNIKLPTDEGNENYIYSVEDLVVVENYIFIGANNGILYVNMETMEMHKVMNNKNIYKLLSYGERVFAVGDTGIYELELEWETN